MELMRASNEWASRSEDERFVSLTDMAQHFAVQRDESREMIVASRNVRVVPDEDNKGLMLVGPQGGGARPTNWAFGQLASLAKAPAGYMRTLPSPLVADCVNYGLKFNRDVEDVGVLLTRNGQVSARAVTGPRYGRVWNADILQGLVARFGDGRGNGSDWKVPGEFGQDVEVTKANTTLFAGDRDMFVFLADERNRIEVPGRRNGQAGEMARGFFVWNSEVGSATLGIATFLFDYVCCNRIVWGAKQYKQVKVRHTPSAPVRWFDEVQPALEQMRQAPVGNIVQAIAKAKDARIDKSGKEVDDWLASRFGKNMPAMMQDIHLEEEGRPIETLWDASVALTAWARGRKWQDDRVDWERKAGDLIDLAAA